WTSGRFRHFGKRDGVSSGAMTVLEENHAASLSVVSQQLSSWRRVWQFIAWILAEKYSFR
ncbi:hypothetical protein, partial [Thiolapillus sp.]|uniref:hypothetical protein n=1 Tax=Thiolapillus sp. TaxID=2017437 RepID=UPI003AF8FA07